MGEGGSVGGGGRVSRWMMTQVGNDITYWNTEGHPACCKSCQNTPQFEQCDEACLAGNGISAGDEQPTQCIRYPAKHYSNFAAKSVGHQTSDWASHQCSNWSESLAQTETHK